MSAGALAGGRTRRWLRGLAWLLGAWLLLCALGWVLVPPLLKRQLERAVSEQIGREIRVGSIEFKPWTLELTLRDLSIAGAAGSTAPQLSIRRLHVDAELESLLRLAPVVESLTIEGPQVRLAHLGQGRYDIDDLLARFAPRPGAPPASGDPARFALFNVAVQDGSFDFDDRPAGARHAVRQLNFAVPFLSNLPSRRDVRVQPRLAFQLNGSAFDSSAETTPFAQTRKTDATLSLRGVDLAPYLPYLPSSLPVRPQSAKLAAELKLAFEQQAAPTVRLSGSVQIDGVQVADARGGPLLAWQSLRVALDDVRPLEGVVRLGATTLESPRIAISRDAAGQLNLPGASAASAPSAAASAAAPAAGGASLAWQVEVASVAITGGGVTWRDATVRPQAEMAIDALDLNVRAIRWPMDTPATFDGKATLLHDAGLQFSGTASLEQVMARASLAKLPLGAAAPYLAEYLEPSVRGQLSAELELRWKDGQPVLLADSLVLSDLALTPSGGVKTEQAAGKAAKAGAQADLAGLKRLEVRQLQVDVARQSVGVARLALTEPRVAVSRGPDGRWMAESWLRAPPHQATATAPARADAKPVASAQKAVPAATPASARKAASPAAAGNASAPSGWALKVAELVLESGQVGFEDRVPSKPVAFDVSGLKLQMKDVQLGGTKPMPLQLSARLSTPRAEPAAIDLRGSVQMAPLSAQGSLGITRLPVHVFEPYFAAGLNVELLRADASVKGEFRYADGPSGPSVQWLGDTVVEDFRAHTLGGDGGVQGSEELLTWKSLNLHGVDLALAPGSATRLSVQETALSDFFARVIVYPDGRINLQNLLKPGTQVGSEGGAAAPGATASAPVAAAPSAPASASATASASANAGLEPVIRFGPASLINGRVSFSDRFVKPNYSANLSELTGRLGSFSSVAGTGDPQLADVELRGRAEGTASLEILGKLNPLAKPLALDIKGKVRDLELAPLSPYSVKYAGYGIERGKLSVDVAYLVKPDGQLTASNQVILNQLTFGDKVEGAPNSLPVKLAVALLSDRNGVIDINLPISGSLNDPQFSLGPIIFKVIVNLVVKAITAPFSLLASAFGGGGDELSMVAFAPGSSVLRPEARTGLDKVAKALRERPGLKMTVVGSASLEAEREAYRRERLQALLLAEKRRAVVAAGGAGSDTSLAQPITDAERPALLREVYRRSDIAKLRTVIGVAKDIPDAEIEVLLLANISVSEETMRDLAVQRGVAVKEYLASRELPVERLFLGAVKAVGADSAWTPRAELTLANN